MNNILLLNNSLHNISKLTPKYLFSNIFSALFHVCCYLLFLLHFVICSLIFIYNIRQRLEYKIEQFLQYVG